MATALATPFYLDTGFSKTEIGLVAKHAGLWPAVIGGLLGGAWMLKLGINRALWVFGVVQCVSILGFVLLDQVGPDLRVLALAIGFEALGVGLGETVAFIALSPAAPTRRTPPPSLPCSPAWQAAHRGQRRHRLSGGCAGLDAVFLLCTVLAFTRDAFVI